jgi:hypothetical protein
MAQTMVPAIIDRNPPAEYQLFRSAHREPLPLRKQIRAKPQQIAGSVLVAARCACCFAHTPATGRASGSGLTTWKPSSEKAAGVHDVKPV